MRIGEREKEEKKTFLFLKTVQILPVVANKKQKQKTESILYVAAGGGVRSKKSREKNMTIEMYPKKVFQLLI